MNDTGTTALKLAVPKSVRAVVGAVIGTVLLTVFLLSSIYLAIYDLLHVQGIIPSLVWLSLIGLIFFATFRGERGKNVGVKFLGAFSRKEFVQIVNNEGRQNEFQFGYQAFGHQFLYFVVAADRIAQIDWDTGQISDRAGRDMNDWHIALWYEHGDPEKSKWKKQYRLRHPDWDVHCFGPTGPKQKISAFGGDLVDFLRSSGISLVQGASDHIFTRPDSQS